MTPLLLVLVMAWLSACGVLSDPGSIPVRIAVSAAALSGATQGDFNSPMDRVDLIVTDEGGARQALSRELEPGEFDPVFDVAVNTGLTSFTVTVVSTDGQALHEGATTATIERDGFEVTIVPQPVRGVIIVSPRRPAFTFLFTSGDAAVYGATMTVRNRGSEELLWRVLPSPSPNQFAIDCDIGINDDVGISCLEFTNLLPQGQVSIQVFFVVFGGGPVPGSGVVFDSNVGDFTVPSTP